MNQDTPEFKAEVQRAYNAVVKIISDQTITKGEHSVRYRELPIPITEPVFHYYQYPLRDLFEAVLPRAAVVLRSGYPHPSLSMEQFDHQARDWVLDVIERLQNGSHPWRQRLKDNANYTAIVMFGYGAIPSADDSELGLLPVARAQLVDYSGEEGRVLEDKTWTVTDNGVLVDPETLKQFGR